MNYLAHLHLAAMTDTSPTGNLLGDFVKGQVSGLNYDDKIKQGIQLHRSIDTFTDSHSYTKSLTRELGSLRRYGGIIIDVLYDHQLAINFAKFHHNSLPVFAQDCYIQLDTNIKHLPDKYITTVSAMKQMDWLSGYGDMNNIERALTGISRRLKKPVELTESLDWYLENQAAIEQDFPEFYNDLIDYAVKTAASNR
ncbi:ACP phosphodiesterase [uncultured Psychrosphaera sp.]|uniref:acyl carrier protein phosphodiesterase n=1 Tax=uncultured Psychrosphaera sp. TaxID=1403522 RepID=UPI002614EF99|nr:ACP phosphodiesterase [uncultured Psychrosphaera sp.]